MKCLSSCGTFSISPRSGSHTRPSLVINSIGENEKNVAQGCDGDLWMVGRRLRRSTSETPQKETPFRSAL